MGEISGMRAEIEGFGRQVESTKAKAGVALAEENFDLLVELEEEEAKLNKKRVVTENSVCDLETEYAKLERQI